MEKFSPRPLFLRSPLPGIQLLDHPFVLSIPQGMQKSPIGKSAEQCFRNAIDSSDTYSLIAHSTPIQGEERTLGELDFILQDRVSGRYIHVEFVYKFYLYIPWLDTQPLSAWIGPNFKDRLTYKLDHLKDHQFPILHEKATQRVLDERGMKSSQMDQALSFYAELFYPMDGKEFAPTGSIDPACKRGYWLFFNDFEKRSYSDSQKFHMCTKREWLVDSDPSTLWTSHEEMIPKVRKQLDRGISPMLWIRMPQRIERLFIIPDAFQKQR